MVKVICRNLVGHLNYDAANLTGDPILIDLLIILAIYCLFLSHIISLISHTMSFLRSFMYISSCLGQ